MQRTVYHLTRVRRSLAFYQVISKITCTLKQLSTFAEQRLNVLIGRVQ